METPQVDFEKNKPKFEDIKEFCKDEKEFDDIVLKISLLEVILGQVNEIFVNSLYNEEAKALIEAANTSTRGLQEEVINVYIKNSKDIGELMPVPDIIEVAGWVEEIHYDIAMQLYSEGFCNSVIAPALETVTSSVIEFANEEAGTESNKKMEDI